MKRIILFLFVPVLFFASCKDNRHFRVKGSIDGGKGHVIYLEQVLPHRINTIDSFKIKRNERFRLKKERPSYPEFYRVRINDNYVIFAIESSETVTIHSKDPYFVDYSITGSKNNRKIHKLNQSIRRVERGIRAFEADVNDDCVTENLEKISRLIAEHDSLARSIIFSDTKSSAAYYAVFHKVNDSRFFRITNNKDMKLFLAVATAYNAFYPHSTRSKELTNLVLQAKRLRQSEELKQLLLEHNQTPTIMNINLPDAEGNYVSLSDLRGKVVLVNFAYFRADQSMEYLYGSRNLYMKYHKKGFEMYGISFDGDIEFFKNVAKRVPWIRVHDEKGLNSDLLETYDIIQLPTLFLLDKKGNIISRHTYLDSRLKENLERLLNE